MDSLSQMLIICFTGSYLMALIAELVKFLGNPVTAGPLTSLVAETGANADLAEGRP